MNQNKKMRALNLLCLVTENKKMTDKYKEALGTWIHELGGIRHEIVPEEDDNYRFLRAKNEAQKKGDGTIVHKRVGELYYDMVTRSGSINEEEQISLKKWISVNINQIVEDFLIAFKWTNKQDLEAIKKKLELPKETPQ